MANISSYNQLSSWNEDDDLLFVQQPDAPKKAHPSQMKEYILEGLDVSSVGGTGKYISEISEADGKINATAETMDDVPTENSNAPVKSGGIKTAIDDSVSLKTATGNPITLTDAANANAEELSMTIEPIQSGSGEPSPTNVRPISGISTASVQTTDGTDTNTATITFGQTVYGGSVNFKTGEVTLTHNVVDLGILTYSQTGNLFYVMLGAIGAKETNETIEGLKTSIYVNGGMRGIASITDYMIASNSNRYFYIKDPRANNAAELATLLSGQSLFYELATPTTLTLTPAELELLKGNNTITANGAEISIEYYPDNAIGALAGRVDDLDNTTSDMQEQIATKVEIQNNAGFHNSIYRGKYLGSEVTAEQYAAIADGTFEDMYIGDYWTIGGVNYRIAAFDYWLHSGDTECTTHHVVLVPDTSLYTAKMNDSSITTGAYVGSAMYTTNLAQAKTTINNAFGASHILNHREYLANAMKATADPTYESAGSWYDSTVELMNERMVYGADIFHNVEVNGAIPANYTIDKSQLALFALDPSRICNRALWWLRCAVSAAFFALVNDNGNAYYYYASHALGVRPAFGIKA